jgi:hypothetical protein
MEAPLGAGVIPIPQSRERNLALRWGGSELQAERIRARFLAALGMTPEALNVESNFNFSRGLRL